MHRNRIAAAAAFLVLAAAASPAAAHVTIPEPAEAGGFAIVTLSVPNERDDSGTATVEVQLPQDHPIAFVSVQPKPGWSAEVTTRTLDEPIEAHGTEITEVVDTVTWTGGPIGPGEFDTFSISVGPLPTDVDALVFPAIQTYESGEEVAWIEEGEDAELPAPVLELTEPAEGSGDHHDDGSTGGVEVDAEAAADTTAADDGGTDALTIVALVVGVLALLVGISALAATRRGRGSPAAG